MGDMKKSWETRVASCLRKKICNGGCYRSVQNLRRAMVMVSLNCTADPIGQVGPCKPAADVLCCGSGCQKAHHYPALDSPACEGTVKVLLNPSALKDGKVLGCVKSPSDRTAAQKSNG